MQRKHPTPFFKQTCLSKNYKSQWKLQLCCALRTSRVAYFTTQDPIIQSVTMENKRV